MKNPVRRTWLVIVSVLLLVLLSLGAVACGAKSYTLTFVTNGGTEIAPITAEAGAAIEPPADPEKDGWVFDGWFTASDFSGEETEIPSVMPEKNITYYAKFTEIPKATLTLDAGVGTLETAVYEMEIGADVSGFVADIVPVTPEGVTFAGWFEGDAPLGEDVTMPAAGIRLTARYTAAYTVEIYLQSAPESEEYTLDADAETEGGSGYLGDAVDLSSSLKAPTGYKLNKTRTQPLVLGTEGNVFKAYYDLSVYTVYYFDNAPQDATVEGEMANGSAYYSYETEIPANGYSIEGYRFAGWATSPRGGVVYQSGDKITASSTLMLYACWNLGITDANGGKDVLYVLKEEPGTIVLERQYAEDRKGIYDEATRTFYFGKGANDNSLPRGRVAADGASFVYYYEAFALTFSRYDWMAEELVAAETIVLDGVDGAVYTYTENGEKKTAEGTYMPEGTSYSFVSDDGAVEFVFALGTLTYGEGEDAEQTDVFLVRDDCAGTYYYMNGSGSIYYFPLIILDGYGEVIYMESISGDGILSGSYVPAGGENTVEVTIETSEGTQNAMYRLTREVPTQSGTTMNVFESADGVQGVYSFRMTGGDGEGTMKVEADGFGELHYTFTPDSGTAVNGDAAYYYLGTYTSGETGYGIFYFTVGTGESAHRYTVRFETEGTGVQLIGSEAGVYSELNPDSPYTARLFLHGDGTAAMYFLMASQAYSPLLEGTYQADGETGNYRFTATSYAENYEESLSVYYADFTFRLYADRAQFSVSDGVDGTYTFSDGDSEWTIVCNGFGYATLTQAGSATGSQVPYELHEGYGNYRFLQFSLSSVFGTYQYYIRLAEGASSGELYTSGFLGVYSDLGNRISGYTEQMQLYPDGHAVISVLSGEEYIPVAEGSYVQGETGGLYTFTASAAPEEKYACYASFTFSVGTLSGNYVFCYYEEGEVFSFVFRDQTLTLTGYGVAFYGTAQTQYFYQFTDGEDGYRYLSLSTFTGSLVYRIRYDEDTASLIEPGDEMGSYYSYLYNEEEGKYLVGEYVLTLDGYGGATLISLNGELNEYEVFATGTYVEEAGDYYTLSWSEGNPGWTTAALSSATVSGSVMSVYITGDAGREMTYEILTDGSVSGKVQTDAFGRMSYTDAEGNVFRAVYQTGTLLIDGRAVLLLEVYDESGSVGQTQLYLVTDTDPDDGRAQMVLTDGKVGRYALVDNGLLDEEQTLTLDGLGNAVWIDENGVSVNGKYTPAEGENEWNFVSDDGKYSFRFLITTVSSADGESHSAYIVYNAETDTELTDDRWQKIMLDGYATATLVDFYGRVYKVNYMLIEEGGRTVLKLYGSTLGNRYYAVDFQTKTFTETVDGDAAA